MNKNTDPRWLEWAKELQFIAQAGLTYSRDPFDIERFERIREISAENNGAKAPSFLPNKGLPALSCSIALFLIRSKSNSSLIKKLC